MTHVGSADFRTVRLDVTAVCFTSDVNDDVAEEAMAQVAEQIAERGVLGRIDGDVDACTISVSLQFLPFDEEEDIDDDEELIDEDIIVEIDEFVEIDVTITMDVDLEEEYADE